MYLKVTDLWMFLLGRRKTNNPLSTLKKKKQPSLYLLYMSERRSHTTKMTKTSWSL